MLESKCVLCTNDRDVEGDRIIQTDPDKPPPPILPQHENQHVITDPNNPKKNLAKCWCCQNPQCAGYLNAWDWKECDACGHIPDPTMKQFMFEYAPQPKKIRMNSNNYNSNLNVKHKSNKNYGIRRVAELCNHVDSNIALFCLFFFFLFCVCTCVFVCVCVCVCVLANKKNVICFFLK